MALYIFLLLNLLFLQAIFLGYQIRVLKSAFEKLLFEFQLADNTLKVRTELFLEYIVSSPFNVL
jgi:hypothetical protein